MKKNRIAAVSCVLFIAVALLLSAGCATMIGGRGYVNRGAPETILKSDQLWIQVAQFHSNPNSEYYIMEVEVENKSGAEAAFNPDEVELESSAPDRKVYTLTKGKTSVTLYSSWAPPLMPTRLAPGQKVKGTIYFQKPRSEAAGETIKIIFQKAAVTIKGNPL